MSTCRDRTIRFGANWVTNGARDAAGKRVAQLHVVPFQGEFWNRIVAFRDALREDAKLAEGYRALKTRLATEFGNDRLRYREEKAEFVASVVNRRLRLQSR